MTIEIRADDDPTRVVVRFSLSEALAAKWNEKPIGEAQGRRLLTLRLLDESVSPAVEGPPLFGSYEVHNGVITFKPKFGLARGLGYRATAYLGVAESLGGANCVLSATEYRVPALKPRPATKVAFVAPHEEVVPANLLKFSVVFSQPMREGREIFERIHLFDAAGKEIHAPWRDIELWTHNGTMLALYIHPGRIKQGVNLREELGPVLRPDRAYTLVVDAATRDADGLPLGEEFRKTFKTGPELRKKIDVAAWKITAPAAGTRDQVLIEFDRALDWPAGNARIDDPAGEVVFGSGGYFATGLVSQYKYRPNVPWRSGTYRLVVDPKLTDRAGNTPHTVFDRDLDSRADDPSHGPIERTFTIP